MAGYSRTDYSRLLLDPRWQRLRLEVFQRDGFTCQCCGAKDRTLHAHHTFYEREALPWDYPVASLVTLCDYCHQAEHAALDEAKKAFLIQVASSGFGTSFRMDQLATMIDVMVQGAADDGARDDFLRMVDAFWTRGRGHA